MKYQKFVLFVFFILIFLPVALFAQNNPAPDPTLPGAIVAILNIFSPIVIKFFAKKVQKREARFAISLILSGVTGAIAALVAGVGLQDSILFVTAAFTFSQLAYGLYWKPLWDRNK